MGVFDSMLVKYGAFITAYGVLGIPVFGRNKEEYLKATGNDTSMITRDYIRNSALMISLAKAIGRIVISYKEVQELAGYTTLVHEIKQVIDDLKAGTPQLRQAATHASSSTRRPRMNEKSSPIWEQNT
jgi:ATP-binding cassette subfamily D (ALD) protein 3